VNGFSVEPAKGFWSYGMNMPKWKCGDGSEWKRPGCNEGSERDYLSRTYLGSLLFTLSICSTIWLL